MASSKEFKNFIIEQLSDIPQISCRGMMGEYVLYYNGIVFGGIYDDRFLIKKTLNNQQYNLSEAIPYKNAKPMYMIENLEDVSYLKDIITQTYLDLQQNKKPNK